MSTELDRRPVPCRARFCTRSVPRNQAVAAAKVLGRDNARGWFCPDCAANGGTRFLQTTGCTPIYIDLELQALRDAAIPLHAMHPDAWLTCQEHPECVALVAFCEAKHDRYGEVLFPRG